MCIRDRVGYALPIRHGENAGWTTGPWFLRSERLYLMPGDSPMGLRLPLDSLPWSEEGDRLDVIERDPFAERDRLPPPVAASDATRRDTQGAREPLMQSAVVA